MARQRGVLVVIQSGATQAFVVEFEADRLDQVQTATAIGAEPDNVAGIGGDFRLKQNHVKHARLRLEGVEDSTLAEPDPRPKLFPRFLASIALFFFLVGMMIGRLQDPAPVMLDDIQITADGMQLLFDSEPKVTAEHVDGALVMRIDAEGSSRQGQLQLDGRNVNWRVLRSKGGLLVNFVAARPLRGQWHGAAEGGRWRLVISLGAED